MEAVEIAVVEAADDHLQEEGTFLVVICTNDVYLAIGSGQWIRFVACRK